MALRRFYFKVIVFAVFTFILTFLGFARLSVAVITPADLGIDTSIFKKEIRANARQIRVVGLATGKPESVETAIRRDDGWFWESATATWTPEPVWQAGVLSPISATGSSWDEVLNLPPLDGQSVLILGRAIDNRMRPDPTPTGAYVFIDNVAPQVKSFDIDGPRWVSERGVNLNIDVEGAKYMRLAQTRARLKRATKIKYNQRAKFQLSSSNGLRNIYGAFTDSHGNTKRVKLTGGPVGLDTAPPVVSHFEPGPKAKSVSVDAKISIRFIEGSDIDVATISSDNATAPTFFLTEGGQRISTTLYYDSDEKIAQLSPNELLVKGKVYTAYVKPGIKDIVGNELKDETSWSFQAVEPSPPETKINSFIEKTNATGFLNITGSAIDPDGVTSILVSVRDPEGRYWDSDATSWTVEPAINEATLSRKGKRRTTWQWRWDIPQSDGARYLITAVAKDSFLAEDQTPAGTYVTVDNQAPHVEGLILQNGLSVTASDTIEIESVVTGARQMRFAQDLTKLSQAPYVRFAPKTELKLSKKPGKKVVYGQWRDEFQNASRPGVAGSVSKIILDKTGPKISSTFPHDNAGRVNISVMITAHFDEISLDESTINNETVRLIDWEGNVVPSFVVFDSASKTMALTPLEYLRYAKDYKVVISGTVKDGLDNTLGEDFEWTFKTIDISDHPPAKPEGVKVVSGRNGDRITWLPPSKKDKGGDFNPPVQGGYNVYRSEKRAGPFELANKVPLTDTKYFDTDFNGAGRRFYMVRAVDAGGSEGEESETRTNNIIKTVFSMRPGKSVTITPSNAMIEMKLPALKRKTKVSVKNYRSSQTPISPMRVFRLDSNPTVQLKRVSIRVPGDPTGAVLVKKTGGAWQPLTSSSYSYDVSAQTITFRSLTADGDFAVVNRVDSTPPDVPSRADVRMVEGKPRVSWSKVTDKDSGISGYQLVRSETSATSTLVEPITINLPKRIHKFRDDSAVAGRQYSYSVAAINGSGQVGNLIELDSTLTPAAKLGHRPRVAGVTNCRLCHLEKRLWPTSGVADCRLCHDGTGSELVIENSDDAGRSSLCRRCHELPKASLDKIQDEKPRPCGGCHADSERQEHAGGTGHTGESGITDLECGNCHSLHRPGGRKNNYLINPTNVRSSWDGSRNDFCLACHKAIGWPRAIDTANRFLPASVIFREMIWAPFFSGWDKTGWEDAGHSRVASCLTCHKPHESPNQRLLAYRSRGGKYVYFNKLTATEELCYECHRPDGPKGAVDIMTLSRLVSNHKVNDYGSHSDTETAQDLGELNRHTNCNDCHNVHKASGQKREPFTNLVSGSIMGVGGVEILNTGPGAIPGYIEVNPAAREYQICLKCHSSYVQPYSVGTADLAIELNPANPSYHPVMARGRNRGLKSSSFVNGWSQKATMYCSDCHSGAIGSDNVPGPHGSKYRPLLTSQYGQAQGTERQNELCYQCHNKKVYEQGKGGSRFGRRGGHSDHVREEQLGCGDCHITHGSSFTEHLIRIMGLQETSGTIVFAHDKRGGSCVSTCHTRPDDAYRYKHSYK